MTVILETLMKTGLRERILDVKCDPDRDSLVIWLRSHINKKQSSRRSNLLLFTLRLSRYTAEFQQSNHWVTQYKVKLTSSIKLVFIFNGLVKNLTNVFVVTISMTKLRIMSFSRQEIVFFYICIIYKCDLFYSKTSSKTLLFATMQNSTFRWKHFTDIED